MLLSKPLIEGILIRRYKRFLADVQLTNGTIVTAHCPNSGSMLTCSEPGRPVVLSQSNNPKRKCKYTWELIKMGRVWVGINTLVPNRLVFEALQLDRLPSLAGYKEIRREVQFGEGTRFDIMLSNHNRRCYVEIKNVTLAENDVVYFPDAVTTRGRKHLRELMQVVRNGDRGVMFYFVQRGDCSLLKPAWHIDPGYAATLQAATDAGVEVIVFRASISKTRIDLGQPIPFEFGHELATA